MSISQEQSIQKLSEENAILRDEVRIARKASDITAELVVKQFVKIEEILLRLEEKANAEEKLRNELTCRLKEAETREVELDREKTRLEQIQVAAINMMEDISAAQREAESATKAKSEFLANMSHEIRTPMTAILGFADALAEQNTNDDCSPETMEAARTIKHNGEYLLSIINDILDLSKIEAGKMTIEKEHCSPVRIVNEVTELMSIRAREKAIAFDVEYIGEIPETISTDRTRLRQILINAVGNAIKFTDNGRVKLTVSCRADNDNPYLVFDIIDTGLGMTEEQVANLFRPFTQADTSMTRRFGGTGLGLVISKRLASLLGGDVVIVKTKAGEGSHFRVSIATGSLAETNMITNPAVTTDYQPKVTQHLSNYTPDFSKRRILLAEDNPTNQIVIKRIISKTKAELILVENGELAVNRALEALEQSNPFDIILMDMQMPVMDGYQATATLRSKGYKGIIIAITAHAMSADKGKCIEAGCDGYATKPINRDIFLQTIDKLIPRTDSIDKSVSPPSL